MNPHLSIVIPAYNESSRIGATLDSIREYLSMQPYEAEVIVVNDGSQDDMAEVVHGYQASMPYLTLIDNAENHGKGYAVRAGMRLASGTYRLFMDADNSVTIDHVAKFLDTAMKGSDVVIGSIRLDESDVHEQNAWYRRALGNVAKFLATKLTSLSVKDTQRGFKLFSEAAAERIFALQTIERFGFDIELLVLAKHFGYKIKELPVIWDNPTGSKVTPLSYFSTLWELMLIRRNMFAGKYKA